MNRKYAKPSISIDIFEANEYIATCFIARCNVDVSSSGKYDVMYRDINGKIGYQEEDQRIEINNDACDHRFKGKSTDLQEYMYDYNGIKKGGGIKVYFWQHQRPYNHHVTTGYKETGSSTA